MNILWLSHFVPYPPAGGALQRSYHLLRYAAQRHKVSLLALVQPKLLPSPQSMAEAMDALSGFCADVKFLSLPAAGSNIGWKIAAARSALSHEPFDVAWLRSEDMRQAVGAACESTAFDVIHVDTIGLWPYVKDMPRIPRLLGHHNIESHLQHRRAAHEPRASKAFLFRRDADKLRQLERAASIEAAVNVVVSPNDAAVLRKMSPSASVAVVDNGVDSSYWSRDQLYGNGLLFAGTLGWYPNTDAVDFLVGDIWPALLGRNADRCLRLVGRDPPLSALRAARDPRVQVTGFVPDVRPFFRESSIYVCPIRVGGGTRLKVLDALASALPLVSTRIGVEGLDLIEGIHYLQAETVADFVTQIDRLTASPGLQRSLGQAGRHLVRQRYDWSVIGVQLMSAYELAASRAMITPDHP